MNNLYQLELEKVKEFIQKGNFQKILLQLPEGMLDKPLKAILEFLSPLRKQLLISGEPSYGACDIAIDLAIKLECDLLLHFGHTNYGFDQKIQSRKKDLEILFIPAFYNRSVSPFLPPLIEKIKHLNWQKIRLVATAQHLKNLKELQQILKTVRIQAFIQNEGQILGCNLKNAIIKEDKIDGIVSLHSGYFHTQGLILNSTVPIVQMDPYSGEISIYTEKDRNKLINQRHGIIVQSRNAKKWGILASTKIGQYNINQIYKVEKILNDNNLLSAIIISENIDSNNLANLLWIEAWINTACPRLAIDDRERFEKPIINYKEFLYLFNHLSWDELLLKGFY